MPREGVETWPALAFPTRYRGVVSAGKRRFWSWNGNSLATRRDYHGFTTDYKSVGRVFESPRARSSALGHDSEECGVG
jgi:hypothetical protein